MSERLEELKKLAGPTIPSEPLVLPRAVITPTAGQAPTYSQNVLFGKLVYVVGEGVKGAYISHKVTRGYEGARYWVITYGVVTVFGRRDSIDYPLYVNGQPSSLVLAWPPTYFTEGFWVHTKAVGTITVREADIKNLEEVLEGRSTVLILDPHGLMGQNLAPLEAVNKIAQLQADLERLARTAYEYEQEVLSYKSMVSELQARVAKYQELYGELTKRVAKYAQEVLDLEVSLSAIRNEVAALRRESDNFDQLVQETLDKLGSVIQRVKEIGEEIAQAPQQAQPPEQAPKAEGQGSGKVVKREEGK